MLPKWKKKRGNLISYFARETLKTKRISNSYLTVGNIFCNIIIILYSDDDENSDGYLPSSEKVIRTVGAYSIVIFMVSKTIVIMDFSRYQ